MSRSYSPSESAALGKTVAQEPLTLLSERVQRFSTEVNNLKLAFGRLELARRRSPVPSLFVHSFYTYAIDLSCVCSDNIQA